MDWTANEWLPTDTSGRLTGEVHGANSAPSNEHMYVRPVWSEVHVKFALVLVVVAGSAGTSPWIVVTAGPTTVQVNSAGVGSAFRFGSTARTSSLCWPPSRPPNSAVFSGGDAQELYSGVAPTGSSAHSNVTPGSSLEKVNTDGRSMLISVGGATSIVVSGAVSSSTLQVQTAGRASTSRCCFTAVTSSVCSPEKWPVASARSARV